MKKNSNKRMSFSALGGLGEIGANCYVYNIFDESQSELLIVDLGMGFNGNRTPSIETFYPDVSYLEKNKKNIKGLVITHAHEDHIGAIAYLYKYLECPIYATSWTADMVYSKLKDVKLHDKAQIILVKEEEVVSIGSYNVRWLKINHSIPDNHLLHISTPLGDIVHSGDFKLDNQDRSIINPLSALSLYDIEYLFCDSTNVLESGHTGNEESIKPSLLDIVSKVEGAAWITLFSSNIERIANITEIARKLSKKIVIVGRSLNKYIDISEKHQLINKDVFIDERDASVYDANKLIYLITGSQGEENSALVKILVHENHRLKIGDKDTVIFSSKVIPGNEKKIGKLYNALATREIIYFTHRDFDIHVSGHPNIEDLKLLYKLVLPKWVVPIHGEVLHLKAQSNLAFALGMATFNCINGEVVELFADEPYIIDNIQTGKVGYDCGRLISLYDDTIKQRNKVFFDGAVFASIALEGNSYIKTPEISIVGLLKPDEETDVIKKLSEIIESHINALATEFVSLNDDVSEGIRVMIRKYFRNTYDKNPIVKVHIIK